MQAVDPVHGELVDQAEHLGLRAEVPGDVEHHAAPGEGRGVLDDGDRERPPLGAHPAASVHVGGQELEQRLDAVEDPGRATTGDDDAVGGDREAEGLRAVTAGALRQVARVGGDPEGDQGDVGRAAGAEQGESGRCARSTCCRYWATGSAAGSAVTRVRSSRVNEPVPSTRERGRGMSMRCGPSGGGRGRAGATAVVAVRSILVAARHRCPPPARPAAASVRPSSRPPAAAAAGRARSGPRRPDRVGLPEQPGRPVGQGRDRRA